MTGWQGQKGTRQERGYGKLWGKRRAAALVRDRHLCQPCEDRGIIEPAVAVDHIIPVSKGGTHELANLQSICHACHNAKTQAEAAEAQGRRIKPNIGVDGWPK